MINTLKLMLERLRSGSGGLQSRLPAMLKSLMPIILLAIGITALVFVFSWHDQASYKPIFGAREKVSASDMMAVLDAEHIPYRVHPESGQVLVPEDKLGRARMVLAAKGVVAKLPAGLELMDRNDPLGVSQFVQDVRFRRGLEGELVQSIMELDAIESARVHLSIAKSTSFVMNDGEKSSASVVVALKPGRTLGPEQIAAVIHLVAGSVASLDPQRVSLIDQAGNLLSAHLDLTDGFDASPNGNEAAKRFEDDTRRNVQDLLAPVLGKDNYKVTVTADVDNDRVEETHEQYGETPKLTNEAMRQESDRERLALGVPGSLSNRPIPVNAPAVSAQQQPAQGAAQGAAPATPDANTAQKSATTRQYTYDRNIIQIKRAHNRLHRMNVAVVLNTAAAPNRKAWTKDEIANIDGILRSGLGIDADRGDQLRVSVLPFAARMPEQAWWQERDNVVDAVSWLSYVGAAVLAYLFIVRPMFNLAQQRLLQVPPVPQLESSGAVMPATFAAVEGQGVMGQGGMMPVVPLLENYDLPPSGSPVDVMVDHLKVLAAKEPERVAEVVKQWVQKNGRTE
jgi:flagellar M-ring protein FliF